MPKYLVMFDSGGGNYNNAPVLVHVEEADMPAFEAFLREVAGCRPQSLGDVYAVNTDIYVKYWMACGRFDGYHNLYPLDIYDQELEQPARLYDWYKLKENARA